MHRKRYKNVSKTIPKCNETPFALTTSNTQKHHSSEKKTRVSQNWKAIQISIYILASSSQDQSSLITFKNEIFGLAWVKIENEKEEEKGEEGKAR